MRYTVLMCLALAAPAHAAPHPMSVTFATAPCTEVVRLIDAPAPDMEGAGRMAMAFGYLLGTEAAYGLTGEGTVLQRFRMACEASPASTGQAILEAMR